MGIDATCALVLLATAIALGGLYGLRVSRAGRFRSDRVEREGSSVLLGKRAMEAAYYALEPVASVCIGAGITANAITIASLALGLAAGVALALDHFGVAALLSGISAIGDALDGVVARRSGAASDAGEVLDAAVDRYVEFFFIGGLAVHYRTNAVALVLALAALLGAFMVSYSTAKAEALHVEAPRGAMRRAERAVYLVGGAALVPLAAALVARLSLGAWMRDAPMLAALALIALMANGSAVRRLRAIARNTRAHAEETESDVGEARSAVR